MSEKRQVSMEPTRNLSVAEIDAVSGAGNMIHVPYFGLDVWADSHGYGASTSNGNFYYAIDVKT